MQKNEFIKADAPAEEPAAVVTHAPEEEIIKPEKYYTKRIFVVFTLLSLAGMVAGALGGYLYYLKVGCTTGACAITSSPYISTAWGGAIGFLIGDLLNGKRRKVPKVPSVR